MILIDNTWRKLGAGSLVGENSRPHHRRALGHWSSWFDGEPQIAFGGAMPAEGDGNRGGHHHPIVSLTVVMVVMLQAVATSDASRDPDFVVH